MYVFVDGSRDSDSKLLVRSMIRNCGTECFAEQNVFETGRVLFISRKLV